MNAAVATVGRRGNEGAPLLRAAPGRHRQCAWCLRLKHDSGPPHGKPLPLLEGYSHGICSTCRAKLAAEEASHVAGFVVRGAEARLAS